MNKCFDIVLRILIILNPNYPSFIIFCNFFEVDTLIYDMLHFFVVSLFLCCFCLFFATAAFYQVMLSACLDGLPLFEHCAGHK